MRFSLQNDSPLPIYEQIVNQVVFAVASKDLVPGDRVPSVRDLAQQLIINANTVARAYLELERMGVTESRRGFATTIKASAFEVARSRRRELIRDRVAEAVREARAAGLTADELHELVGTEWETTEANG